MTESQLILNLAGLLEAGLSLPQARGLLAIEIADLAVATQNQLSQLLLLAETSGGPVAQLLEALADRLDNQQRLMQQIALAAASPKATAKLVSFLPLICLGLAQLLGINVLSTFARNPIAVVSALVGVLLLMANRRWVARSLARAQADAQQQVVGLQELGGLTLQLAAGLSATSLRQQKLPPEVDECFALAQTHGVALLPLLRSQLRHLELRARFEVEHRLAALAIKLLVPIGLLVLPALVFMAVIPAGLALLAKG